MSRLNPLRLVKVQPPPLKAKAGPPSLLNFEEADRFKNLLLFAKSQVEGYFSGKHRSPFYGSNVEFADYKEYVAGEDIGSLDWRVYARTRKLFLRRYEEETDMISYLFVDTSASMHFDGGGIEKKSTQALKIAAVLSYLMLRQGDKVSLTLFADSVKKYLPPGGTRRHLHTVLTELENVKPASRTAIAQTLRDCASFIKRRGCLVILSDFLGDLDDLYDALGPYLHRKYEVLLLQVVAPDELELPDVGIARFVDMETGERVEVDPGEIRSLYQETMEERNASIARFANRPQVTHRLIDTRHPYLSAMEAWFRVRRGHGRNR